MKNTFPKELRLLSADDFERLRQNPGFASSGLFLFFHKPSTLNSDKTRIGIGVSKKVCSKAVGRNLLKRLIRETFRSSGFKSMGKDVMIVVNRKKFRNLEEAKKRVKTDLLNGFKKISNS